MPPDPSNQSDLISSPPQLSLNYMSAPYQMPEWMAVIYWIAGAAAVMGVAGTISCSVIFSSVLTSFADVFSRHPRRLLSDVIWIAKWIIGVSSSVAVMWSAWWCILRIPSAANPLRWGCIGLVSLWIIGMATGLYTDTGLILGDHKDYRQLFFNISSLISELIYDLALPVFLFGTAVHPATRRMIGSARDMQKFGNHLPACGTPDEGVAVSDTDPRASVAAGIAHIRYSVGIVAMVIGAIAPVKTLLFSLVFRETASWTMASSWSLQSKANLEELSRNVVGLLLFAGGLAVLKRWQSGRRLLTIGAVGTLAVIFYDRLFVPLPRWNFTLTNTLMIILFHTRIIAILVLMIGLLSCQVLRMTTADDDQFPHQTP